jgi:hypothetical protein
MKGKRKLSRTTVSVTGTLNIYKCGDVDTFQPHFVTDDLKELVKQGTVFVVVQDFLLGVLPVFDVDNAHFQLGFDEDLWVQAGNIYRPFFM